MSGRRHKACKLYIQHYEIRDLLHVRLPASGIFLWNFNAGCFGFGNKSISGFVDYFGLLVVDAVALKFELINHGLK